MRDHERRATQPGCQRVAGQRDGLCGQPLADPGAAAGLAEHRPAVGRVPRARRPVHVDQQVGHGGRRQQRLVPPGGQRHRALGPVEALAEGRVKAGDVDVGEVPGRRARPGRAGQVGRLRVQLDPSGRLVVPQPQSGRGAEERADRVVFGEPVELPPRRLCPAQGLAERGGEVAQHADLCPARRRVPSAFFYAERSGLIRSRQLRLILGRSPVGGRALSLAHHLLDLVGTHPGSGDDAGRRAVGASVDGDDGELAGLCHAVGGQRVARPAQVGAGGLLRYHHAVIAPGGSERALDGFLGRECGHWPSSAVLRIRTPRNRQAGQPWLTGATWPGWPFPQLNAPQSR